MLKSQGLTPHDTFFRAVFEDPQSAAVELCAVLPPQLLAKVDLATLRVASGTLTEPGEPQLHTDMLYDVQFAGRSAQLYVVLEHQSSVDRWMPLRMLRYVVRLFERYLRTHPDAQWLPVVIPVVLHHSENGWTAPTALIELFEPPQDDETAALLPAFRFLLDDVSHKSDAELMARAADEPGSLVPVALWAMRDGRNGPRLIASLKVWASTLRRLLLSETGAEAIKRLYIYISQVSEGVTGDTLLRATAEAVPETETLLMTPAEQWKQEGLELGRKEGRKEGHLEGRREGRLEGERLVLEKLLRMKFGELPTAARERLSHASDAELALWAERLLTATDLDDALAV